MPKYLLFLLIPIVLFISCKLNRQLEHSYTVILKKRVFDLKTGESMLPRYEKDRLYRYYDSCAVIENLYLYINEDQFGKETWEMLIHDYTFADFRNKSFYIVSSFSDTAKVKEKFVQPDTGKVHGGWNFFTKKSLFSNDQYQFISDTTISKIKYRRIRGLFINKAPQAPTNDIIIGYLRCDLKNTPFSADPVMSILIGCPLLRIDMIGENATLGISTEYEYLSNKLTAQELHIFKTLKEKIKHYNNLSH